MSGLRAPACTTPATALQQPGHSTPLRVAESHCNNSCQQFRAARFVKPWQLPAACLRLTPRLCREEVVAAALAARRRLLVSIASGLLSAISYCHQRGVAHCGIGAGEAGRGRQTECASAGEGGSELDSHIAGAKAAPCWLAGWHFASRRLFVPPVCCCYVQPVIPYTL